MKTLDRRQFLKRTLVLPLLAVASGAGVAACTPGAAGQSPTATAPSATPAARATQVAPAPTRQQPPGDYGALDPREAANFANPLNLPSADGGLFGVLDLPDSQLELAAGRQRLEVLRGSQTDVLAYRVESGGKTYFNPVLRARDGDAARLRLANALGEETIVHWHGLHVDWRNDGHPSYAVGPGESYDYGFTVRNRAATYWYHPHPHGRTGPQAYRGLAGLFIVEDEDEDRLRQALDLEFGATDIPLVIQDKLFDDRGQLVYLPNGMMDQFTGFFGDTIAVNMSVNPSLDVSTRLYRFRVLNGSNARTYRLAFRRGNATVPFTLVGSDGGFLASAQPVREAFLSPAERADVLLDLRELDEGEVVFLDSLPFDPMHNEMGGMGGMGGHGGMGGMGGPTGQMSEGRLPDGEGFHVLRLAVRKRTAYDKTIPTTLSQIEAPTGEAGFTRTFELAQGMMMRWTINGRVFEMNRALFSATRGAQETWEVTNVEASMPHPMHLHGVQFRVVERRGSPPQARRLAVDDRGRQPTDLGWKDTVLVWPGETVVLAADFSHDFAGEQTYLWHCHNLEHEDQGMMVNYRVT